MNKLKIAFCNFWPDFIPEREVFYKILSQKYDIEINLKNPDLIIYSVFQNGANHLHFDKNIKRIFYSGENLNNSNYIKTDNVLSFSFNPTENNNIYFPLWQKLCMENNEYNTELFKKVKYKNFEEFCSFIVSNPNNMQRNSLFIALNKYKKINSFGRYKNNNSLLVNLRDEESWHHGKITEMRKHPHKFNIAFENSSSTGYITEKIMDSFLCGSIPIYKGANDIIEWFNEDSFINANNLTQEELIKHIIEVDTNDDLFKKYYEQPVFTAQQIINLLNNYNLIENSILNFV